MKSEFATPAGVKVARLARDGHVFVLTLCNGDNRFSTATVGAITEALAVVERTWAAEGRGPAALVTVGEGKFFSNGIDFPAFKETNFLEGTMSAFLKRVLLFPIPTVACLNGHAFAGGALITFCHDYVVMREDRGFICMNEVLLPGPLTPGMAAVVRKRIRDPVALRNCLLEAHRFDAREAVKLGIVDMSAAGDELLGKAVDLAASKADFANAGLVYGMIKEETYSDAAEKLDAGLGVVAKFVKTMGVLEKL